MHPYCDVPVDNDTGFSLTPWHHSPLPDISAQVFISVGQVGTPESGLHCKAIEMLSFWHPEVLWLFFHKNTS